MARQRIYAALSDRALAKLDAYMQANEIEDRSEAIRRLVWFGLTDFFEEQQG